MISRRVHHDLPHAGTAGEEDVIEPLLEQRLRDVRVAFKSVDHAEAYEDATLAAISDQEEAGLEDLRRVEVEKLTPLIGAEILGPDLSKPVDERTFKAKVSIKVGPESVSYRATLVVQSLDDAAYLSALLGGRAHGRVGADAHRFDGAPVVQGKPSGFAGDTFGCAAPDTTPMEAREGEIRVN